MDTQNLNIIPCNVGQDNNNDKATKTKKVAGKAAQFAGAAGVGVAGTMAANAMSTHEEDPEVNDAAVVAEPTETTDETVATPEEFDPNDIMIDDVEEIDIDEDEIETTADGPNDEVLAIVDEPQPITGENINNEEIAMIDVDSQDVNPDSNDIIPDITDDIEMDNYDDSNALLADNGDLGDIDSDPNILDDILNA